MTRYLDWSDRLAYLANRFRGPLGWLLAVALYLTAMALWFALSPWLRDTPFITLFWAVSTTALLSGWKPAILVTLLGALSGWYLFLPPTMTFVVKGPDTYVPIAIFTILNICQIVLIETLVSTATRLRSAMRAQETLFRELQHRVANNMQVLGAMLARARNAVGDPRAAEFLDHAEARIETMAQLHRRLHDPNAYARGLRPLLEDLLTTLFEDLPVRVTLDIRGETLSMDQLTAIALLVSEAATNAVKHVFRPEQGTSFEVHLSESQGGHMRLLIRDDGPGVAPAMAGSDSANSLGMEIMEALARQLGGKLGVESGAGTTLSVEFSPAH